VARNDVPEAWDRIEGRLVTQQGPGLNRFRTQMAGLHDLSSGFLVLLEEWGVALESLMGEIDGRIPR
jgi:hypothetical protein